MLRNGNKFLGCKNHKIGTEISCKKGFIESKNASINNIFYFHFKDFMIKQKVPFFSFFQIFRKNDEKRAFSIF